MKEFYTGDPQPQPSVADVVEVSAVDHDQGGFVTVDEARERGYPLTVEEASRVNLLRHPRQYSGHLALYGGTTTGSGPFPTPGELKRMASAHEKAKRTWALVKSIEEADK
jgi:hypothetical protein